ncbi:sensor histidine kinase [Nocardia concava]|uniref:sensor histidine kinase n=1 Tax=Nocardia concava TaxID=257281 RepID=UPI000685F534|nr:ATP-binding protein [Nocardia concava]
MAATLQRAYKDYRESEDTRQAVSLALNVQDLTDQIQRELGLSNGLLGGDGSLQQPLQAQRHTVDTTLDTVKAAAGGDAPGADQVRAALAQLNLLGNTRTQVDTRRVSRPVVLKFYGDAVSALNGLTLGLDRAADAELQRGLQAFYALGSVKEQFDKERGFLNGVFVAGHFSGGEYGQFLEIRSAKQSALQSFARFAGTDRRGDLDEAMRGDDATRVGQDESIALASGDGPLARPVDPATWWTRMTGVIDAQRTVQKAVGGDIRSRADALRDAAQTQLIIFLVGAAIAIAAMIALVLASVRNLVRPLATLAGEADEVASRRLPGVIDEWSHALDSAPEPPAAVRPPAGASAEIAAVADALDRVQTTAFELASQQALVRRNTVESMGSLARRNQKLVHRQLALISHFEREELDPQGLANLFELDHLATRMRRNAESLLVLVGENSPRRVPQPISLVNVIRAGMSEVDDYRRVVLRRIEDVFIVGSAASELSHMLAELLENGLAFSPPDLDVEVYGRRAAQGYLLAVVDHGVGMTAEQLAQSNAKLRGEQDFIVAPTRYLGHYVVGRLAQRLGIEIELNTSPVSGIVARLTLPPELLATEGDLLTETVQESAAITTVEPTWGSDPAPIAAPAPEPVRAAIPRAAEPVALPEYRAPEPVAPPEPPAQPEPLAQPERTWPERVALPPSPEPDTAPVHRPPRPAAAPDPDRLTTRNGLVKRNKAARAATATTQQRPAPAATPPPAPEPVAERTPEQTRSMLAAFRAGHERAAEIYTTSSRLQPVLDDIASRTADSTAQPRP